MCIVPGLLWYVSHCIVLYEFYNKEKNKEYLFTVFSTTDLFHRISIISIYVLRKYLIVLHVSRTISLCCKTYEYRRLYQSIRLALGTNARMKRFFTRIITHKTEREEITVNNRNVQ